MVEIPESYLVTFAGLIFVPLFIFLMKMIMEQGTMQHKVTAMMSHIEESKKLVEKINGHDTEIQLIKLKLNQVEEDLRSMFFKHKGRSDISENNYSDHV